MKAGVFTISLDVELFWGVRDKRALEDYKKNILGVPSAVEQMLSAFSEAQAHATWAVVGFLFHRDAKELNRFIPETLPEYSNAALQPYKYIEDSGALPAWGHFAPSLIKRISITPGQEVGSHTYSHYYCVEEGQCRDAFRADLQTAVEVARQNGLPLSSLVFPRNQVNDAYLPILSETGFTAYRGTETGWCYKASSSKRANSPLKRAIRLLDAYVNITGHHCYDLKPSALPINVPASRFLRACRETNSRVHGLHVRRIKQSMTHAAKSGTLFHLWWHPHNFGIHTDANIAMLREILAHYTLLRERYGMRSLNMGEVAAGLRDGTLT